jgi:hypothetical protein
MGIAERIGRPAYRGCPFLNLVTEVPDQNYPGRVVAQGNKEELRARLATIVAKLGASKTCSCCGSVKAELDLSQRVFRCGPCGFVADRDCNACDKS